MSAQEITLTVATGLSLLMLLPVLGQYVELFPSVWSSMFRTSVCIRLEDNKKAQRRRDRVFLLSIFPYCALIWQSGVFSPRWMRGVEAPWDLLIIVGVVALYCLLRLALERLIPHRKLSTKVYEASVGCQRSFLLVYDFFLLVTLSVLSLCDASLLVRQMVILCLTAAFYALFLVRRFQIFASNCNFLTAILYLCALELPPTALLVVPGF